MKATPGAYANASEKSDYVTLWELLGGNDRSPGATVKLEMLNRELLRATLLSDGRQIWQREIDVEYSKRSLQLESGAKWSTGNAPPLISALTCKNKQLGATDGYLSVHDYVQATAFAGPFPMMTDGHNREHRFRRLGGPRP